MPSFVARSLAAPKTEDAVLALSPVLRAHEWAVLTSVQAVAERWQADALAGEQTARAQAACLLAKAETERARLEREAREAWEACFIEQARALEIAYQAWRLDWQKAMTARLDQALEMALQRVSLNVNEVERLRCVTTVLQEAAGPLEGARLQLSSDDYERAAYNAENWPWPLEQDSTLKPGQCRLQGKDGCWLAEFTDVIDRLIRKEGDQL